MCAGALTPHRTGLSSLVPVEMSRVTITDVIARLDRYSKRLRESVVQAQCLNSTFKSLNESEEWRRAISGTPVSAAANIVQHAVLRELILIIVRVLDRPRGKLENSDKVSFPVIAAWLDCTEIRQELFQRARNWFGEGYRAEENERTVRDAMERLQVTLKRLATEAPNREKRLRNFRDEFLAHELHFDIPRDKPLFGHISEMLEEVKVLSEATALAVEGASVAWNFVNEEMRHSADEMWRAVADSASRQAVADRRS